MASITDARNNTTQLQYNERRKTWTCAYDALGRLIRVTGPLTHITQFGYSAMS